MKKVFLTLFVAISTLTLSAQTEKKAEKSSKKTATPEERATKQTERMNAKLTFAPEQKKNVYTINVAKNIKIDEAFATKKDDKKAFGQEKKKINLERTNEIKAILTPAQIEVWNKLKKEAKEKKAKKGKNTKGAKGDKATTANDEQTGDEDVMQEMIQE